MHAYRIAHVCSRPTPGHPRISPCWINSDEVTVKLDQRQGVPHVDRHASVSEQIAQLPRRLSVVTMLAPVGCESVPVTAGAQR